LVISVRDISSGIGPLFPLAGGLCKFYAKVQAASQSTFINEQFYSTGDLARMTKISS
jgi:hypothetical protein